jgi:hypothetical protein
MEDIAGAYARNSESRPEDLALPILSTLIMLLSSIMGHDGRTEVQALKQSERACSQPLVIQGRITTIETATDFYFGINV